MRIKTVGGKSSDLQGFASREDRENLKSTEAAAPPEEVNIIIMCNHWRRIERQQKYRGKPMKKGLGVTRLLSEGRQPGQNKNLGGVHDT